MNLDSTNKVEVITVDVLLLCPSWFPCFAIRTKLKELHISNYVIPSPFYYKYSTYVK